MWFAKTPIGPTMKFHVTNGRYIVPGIVLTAPVIDGRLPLFLRLLCIAVHTMAELKLSGNHLKYARPVLSFDAAFDELPHLQVMKEMFVQTFAAPRRHHKVKPFFDHVMSFTVADNRIWIRNYQVLPNPDKKKAASSDVTLVEVGPRVTLNPIKMFAGSFGGPVIYDNPTFVSPNTVR